jgi:signal transduction histidine kinase
MSTSNLSELEAALLQAVITLGVAVVCIYLFRQYRKPYFLWWSAAWLLYVLRIGAIIAFLTTAARGWLYVHQVLTGWTALALLWAAILFSQRAQWRWQYVAIAAFPVAWAYFAIYRLENFLLAAGPTVVFLSFATMWTAFVFFAHWRRTRSRGAAVLTVVLGLWALHHLDYPILRAQGAWNPWGYYLDIVFVLATGAGILLLVLEDLQRGLKTLLVLSGDLQPRHAGGDIIDALLARPLALADVRGSALYLGSAEDGRFIRGVGACQAWPDMTIEGELHTAVSRAITGGGPQVVVTSDRGDHTNDGDRRYIAALPVLRGGASVGALAILGSDRDPFTALGEEFLLGIGRHVGAALENADLWARLQARTEELERLSVHALQQHEDERRRISLALHDETAQVFAAVKMQLGLLGEAAPRDMAPRFDRVLSLVDAGLRSVRSVTSDLRPPLLDDLGLLPALRALVATFREQTGLDVRFEAPPDMPPLSKVAELALFRALQEALSNVATHARATAVAVTLSAEDAVVLAVGDNGRGFPPIGTVPASGHPHMGITGMRERLAAVGGTIEVRSAPASGTEVRASVPLSQAPVPDLDDIAVSDMKSGAPA